MTELRFPSPADVQSIVDPDNDPILRNLRITQGYHDLSAEMLRLTGRNDINWCTLGCWASKTAGKFIRSEEVPREFRWLLTSKGPFEEIEAETKGLGLVNVAAGIIDDVSTYITAGNRVVFEELAGVFSSFLTELGDDEHRDQKKLDAFTARLEPGPPEPDDATIEASGKIVTKRRGGQDLMRKMVESLYSAKFETDPKRRAELLLLSNGCGGLHEQTRLQTYIAGSLNAPIADTVLRHAHDHVDRHIHESKKSTLHTFLERILPSIGKTVEKAWQDFSTIALMTLQLPDGAMHLARLMPADPGGPLIPPVLQRIEHPELRNMLARFEALDLEEEAAVGERAEDHFKALIGLGHQPSDDALAVGATDWVNLDQRMKYILALFRSRAQDRNLTDRPFSAAQSKTIASGAVPGGKL